MTARCLLLPQRWFLQYPSNWDSYRVLFIGSCRTHHPVYCLHTTDLQFRAWHWFTAQLPPQFSFNCNTLLDSTTVPLHNNAHLRLAVTAVAGLFYLRFGSRFS